MARSWRPVEDLSSAAAGWRGELVEHAPIGVRGIPPRPLWAYLPRSYAASGPRRPLLVLHDGQNLFDPEWSFAGSWRVPAAIDALDRTTGAAPVVIGVPNGGARRLREYTPFRDHRLGGGGARQHLRFLLDEVVPRAERAFRVERRPSGRGVGGSSLGASVSLWAAFEARGELGAVLAMSPTTRFAGEALRDYLRAVRRPPPLRVYLDCGLEEGRRPGAVADAPTPTAYVRRVRRLRRALERLGLGEPATLRYVEEPGGRHEEAAWARRLPTALDWLYRGGDAAPLRYAGR